MKIRFFPKLFNYQVWRSQISRRKTTSSDQNSFTFGNLEVEYSESNQGEYAAGYQGMEYLVKNVDLEVEFHTNQIFLKKITVKE